MGVEGDDEVVLIPVSEGHEGVVGGHALLGEQLGIRAVAMDDQTPGEGLGQLAAAELIALHHLAVHAQMGEDIQ